MIQLNKINIVHIQKGDKNNMDTKIRNNERFKYLHELPVTMELYNFIKFLDEKYHVNSKDPDNSFGQINPETTTISNLYFSNILYLAKVDKPERILELPKYQSNNPNESMILLSDNDIALLSTKNPTEEKILLDTLEDADLGKLIRLRLACQKELLENKPRLPEFLNKKSEEPELSNTEKDEILEKQGFASHRSRKISKTIPVTTKTGTKGEFSIEYYRLGNNSSPHFSTSYSCKNRCGQAQEAMDHNHPAYAFYKKWDVFHGAVMTTAEWEEMYRDLQEIINYVNNN